tara:strand:- start:35 stop:433 length:399 start_codon:yes stop_codon:yes gene_type:complete
VKFSEIELPSNKKFGFFFAFVFFIIATYFLYSLNLTWTFIFAGTSFVFFVIAVTKADILLPLNKIWMRFGLLLGLLISPIILGIIFFGLFTPIAIFIRSIGRDELRLKLNNKTSHWIHRNEPIKSESFKQQF